MTVAALLPRGCRALRLQNRGHLSEAHIPGRTRAAPPLERTDRRRCSRLLDSAAVPLPAGSASPTCSELTDDLAAAARRRYRAAPCRTRNTIPGPGRLERAAGPAT